MELPAADLHLTGQHGGTVNLRRDRWGQIGGTGGANGGACRAVSWLVWAGLRVTFGGFHMEAALGERQCRLTQPKVIDVDHRSCSLGWGATKASGSDGHNGVLWPHNVKTASTSQLVKQPLSIRSGARRSHTFCAPVVSGTGGVIVDSAGSGSFRLMRSSCSPAKILR